MAPIYVVIWEDRHTDTTVHLFARQERAIEWARTQAHDCNRNWGVTEQVAGAEGNETWFARSGLLYHAEYGEACSLRVVAETVKD